MSELPQLPGSAAISSLVVTSQILVDPLLPNPASLASPDEKLIAVRLPPCRSTCTFSCERVSHTLISLKPPVASTEPSGENASEGIVEVWPCNTATSWRLATSQRPMARLRPAASVAPSGEKRTEGTASSGPLRIADARPVPTSQSLMVLSPLPLARIEPSIENATDST